VALCAYASDQASGPCEAATDLRFLDVTPGDLASRLLVLSELNGVEIDLVSVAGADFTLTVEHVVAGAAQAAVPPFTLAAGDEARVRIGLATATAPGDLPQGKVALVLSTPTGPQTLEVAITGNVAACAANTDSCDGAWSTGCETTTTTSNDHCGQCDKVALSANVWLVVTGAPGWPLYLVSLGGAAAVIALGVHGLATGKPLGRLGRLATSAVDLQLSAAVSAWRYLRGDLRW
jgi:hypothetical protein